MRSFRAAVEHGVDLVEFDVIDLPRGPLVVAHSDHLDEVSHGAAHGRLRERTLSELRAFAPELPTLEEALDFFGDEATSVGLHVDLKLTTRVDELVASIVAPRPRRANSRQLFPCSGSARGRRRGADDPRRLHLPGGPLQRVAAAVPLARRSGRAGGDEGVGTSARAGDASAGGSVGPDAPARARDAGRSGQGARGGGGGARVDGRRPGRPPACGRGRRRRSDQQRSSDLRRYVCYEPARSRRDVAIEAVCSKRQSA